VSRFHFDVVDGYYAPNLIFGPQLIQDVRKESKSFLDAHLAVLDMNSMLELFLNSGANLINMQFETCENTRELINRVHSKGLDVGLCITLETEIDSIVEFLGDIEFLNLLAVNPGIGGQKFRYSVCKKIEKATNQVQKLGVKTRISVDGGINESTILDVMHAGADVAIAGSGIFTGDIVANISRLKEIIG
jgi:ribulose-phosphate 3-epimerase